MVAGGEVDSLFWLNVSKQRNCFSELTDSSIHQITIYNDYICVWDNIEYDFSTIDWIYKSIPLEKSILWIETNYLSN